jgi:PleD family two-component response regulator
MDTVMIAVGDRAKCDAFERAVPTAADYVIHRAKGDNSKVVGEQIIKYLDSRARSKKKKEESEQQKKETSATPAASSIDELLAAAAEAVNELRDMPKKTPGVRHHVLVVDDDSSMLRMIKEILCTEYDVATAINGKVALKFLENRKTDIILLDYEMPVQSGAEVYGKILENPATKDIPVVFLTGVSDRDRIAEVLAMRPRGYLLKPIDSDRLKKTIEEIVG